MTKADDRRELIEEQNVITPATSSSEPEPTTTAKERRVARIRELNDRLRTTGRGGMTVMTNGIGALGLESVNRVFAAVASFTDFNADNDSWSEHDCAAMTVQGIRIIWKIDTCPKTMPKQQTSFLLSKGLPPPSMASASCIPMVRVCPRMMSLPMFGSNLQPHRI